MNILILLLCSQLGWASATEPNPEKNVPQKKETLGEPQDVRPLEEMGVTPIPPSTSTKDLGFFYPYTSSLTFYSGLSINMQSPSWPPESMAPQFGLSYMFESLRYFHWEMGFDVLASGMGRFYGGGRWIRRMTGRVRPYVFFGPGVNMRPEDQLATFIRYQNYFLRLAPGIESSLTKGTSVRTELFLGGSLNGSIFAGFNLGLTFGIN